MRKNWTLLALAMTATLLAGCSKQEDAASATPEPAASTAPVATSESDATAGPEAAPAAEAAAATVADFDITSLPVSTTGLPDWPYVALPAGYEFDDADDLGKRSKDLARVPVWTGSQLLWVEGKVFSDNIDNSDGKTYSKFEVRKNIQQAVEALGGVRLSERSFDNAVYKANEKAVDDFRKEFSRIRDAYWYDSDADTYVIRRADKAIWVVFESGNNQGALMVAEGPLPEAPTK